MDENISAFLVFFALDGEEVILFGLLEPDSNCFLQRRVRAEHDTCRRSKSGSDDIRRADQPTNAPSRGGKGLCGRVSALLKIGSQVIKRTARRPNRDRTFPHAGKSRDADVFLLVKH